MLRLLFVNCLMTLYLTTIAEYFTTDVAQVRFTILVNFQYMIPHVSFCLEHFITLGAFDGFFQPADSQVTGQITISYIFIPTKPTLIRPDLVMPIHVICEVILLYKSSVTDFAFVGVVPSMASYVASQCRFGYEFFVAAFIGAS